MNRKERRRRQKEQSAKPQAPPQSLDQAKISTALSLHQSGQIGEAKRIYEELLRENPENSQALHFLGLAHHQEGDQNQAAKLLERAVVLRPDVPEFHNNLGSVFQALAKHSQALNSFKTAVSLKPDYVVALNNLGSALRDLGRLNEAAKALESCLKLDARYGGAYNTLGTIRIEEGRLEDAFNLFAKSMQIAPTTQAAFNLGNLLQNQGRASEAEEAYLASLRMAPGLVDAHNNLGNLYQKTGRKKQAEDSYRKALELSPNHLQVLNNLASVLRSEGRIKEAELFFKRAIEVKPGFSTALLGLAAIAQEAGKLQEAHDYLKRALNSNPKYAEAWNNLGNVFKDWGDPEQAIACFKKALELYPGFAGASFNLGIAYKKNSQIQEAIQCFREALVGDPGMAEAHYYLGNALKDLGKTAEAIDSYRKALEIRPALSDARASLLHEFRNLCNWDEGLETAKALDQSTFLEIREGKKTGEQPHLNVTRCDDLRRNFEVACSWSRELTARMQDLRYRLDFQPRPRTQGSKIKLGYLSNDFHNHPCAHLYKELFGLHHRDDFEVFLYSHGVNDKSVYRRRSERDADHFIEVQSLGDADAARRIHTDQIDILIDLQGYTKGNRLEILALRPAPVQVAWLGFPGTSGAYFIDFILTDKIVSPPQDQEFYSEKFVYLPHCYQITDSHQDLSENQVTRENFDLPTETFVFSSFNQNYKLEPVMFDAWMKILKACDRSILWLLHTHPEVVENLRSEAKSSGVDPSRLVFSGLLTKPEHLARLSLSDLVLDTRICNGHTTTSDALFAGVPVLTLKGKHFSSRVSASILSAVGLEDLITTTLEDYIALAVKLGSQTQGTQNLKARLAVNRKSKPLFDTPGFVRDLEECYRGMLGEKMGPPVKPEDDKSWGRN